MPTRFLIASVALAAAATAGAQGPTPPDTAAQRDALAKLAMLDGNWSGTAVLATPGAPPRTLRHTERVGALLGGTVRVIEGRSYTPDGADGGFNALAIVSYDDKAKAYAFRTYAQGFSGTFVLTAPGDGFSWGYTAGPVTLRYTATVKDGSWHEEGWMTRAGAAPVRIIQLDLKRTGATDWPGGGAPKP